MKKSYVFLTIIGVILLVAILTNPNQDRHKEVLKNKLNAVIQKEMANKADQSDDGFGQAGEALGMMFGSAIVDRMIDNMVSADNYVLFSITKITVKGESKTIGVGVFGNVYLVKELDDKLNNALQDTP